MSINRGIEAKKRGGRAKFRREVLSGKNSVDRLHRWIRREISNSTLHRIVLYLNSLDLNLTKSLNDLDLIPCDSDIKIRNGWPRDTRSLSPKELANKLFDVRREKRSRKVTKLFASRVRVRSLCRRESQ